MCSAATGKEPMLHNPFLSKTKKTAVCCCEGLLLLVPLFALWTENYTIHPTILARICKPAIAGTEQAMLTTDLLPTRHRTCSSH